MTSITLGEIAAGGAAYLVYRNLYERGDKKAKDDERETVDVELERRIADIKAAGGANPVIITNLQKTLAVNGVGLAIPPGIGNDPAAVQAFLSLAADRLRERVASLPTYRAPDSRISYRPDTRPYKFDGWRTVWGTETGALPQGDRLIS